MNRQNWKAKHAWLEIARAEPPKRSAADRVFDFREIYGPYDEATASEQASRCIQCPNPPCVEACPFASPIPELLNITADGQFKEAVQLFFSAQNMPELFVHICAGESLCEAACILGGKSDPVPIASIGRFLLDYAWKHGLSEPPTESFKGQRVAVIGSGLCGLVAADELSRLGYAITVFDSYPKPGGRFVNGLPGFRVDRTLIERRVELLKQRGVQFRMGVVCGRELTLETLRHDFNAVLFALGRAEPLPLKIPGANLRGVHQAYPFVMQKTSGVDLGSPPVEVRDRRVVVLGGGETAIDTVRVAIRCNAGNVLCVYRRDQASMSAPPKEYQDAVEEGVSFLFSSQPVAIIGNSANEVTHVRCVRMELDEPDASGRRDIKPVANSEFDVPADVVLAAYGFAPPTLFDGGKIAELAVNEHHLLLVDANQMTNLPGVFAAGSIVRGGSIPLMEVVRDARRATAAIDLYLATRRSPVTGW